MSTQLTTKQDQAVPTGAWRRPQYEVREEQEAFTVRVRVPGVRRDGVDISVEGDLLHLTATRHDAAPEGWRPLRRELPRGNYKLQLRLNVPVNEDGITARVSHGILELTLPKADEIKPRRISVE